MRTYSVLLIILVLFSSKVKSQEHFLLPDSPTKCHLIKEGKFLRKGDTAKKWHLVTKKDSQREYFNNGKDYIKYKLEFLDNCTYKATITGKTPGKNAMRIGDVINNKIIETDHQFIKIESVIFNKKDTIVLEKIE